MLDYVDARYVMEALDRLGPENWQDAYVDRDGGAVRCGIGILVDGEWVWKWDVGTTSDIEPEKGSYSEAFKRAAVKWGIARDLYGHKAKSSPAPTPVDRGTPKAPTQTAVANRPTVNAPVEPPLPPEPGFTDAELLLLAEHMDGVLHEPAPRPTPPAFGENPPCPIHHVPMRRNSKGLWHRLGSGDYCHGKVER